jgi:hypothetical protein
MAELVLEVFDDKVVVRHVGDQADECEGVHEGCVVAVDVESKESVDKKVGRVNNPFVAVGDAAGSSGCCMRLTRWNKMRALITCERSRW